MIKVTHIQKQDETHVARRLANYINSIYPYYYEVKVYGNGTNHAPTSKFIRGVRG